MYVCYLCKSFFLIFILDDPKEKDSVLPISRKTALWYINKHLDRCNEIVSPVSQGKRKRHNSDLTAFGFEGGILKLKPSASDTRMEDVFDVMSKKEIQEYHLKRAMENLEEVFPAEAETTQSE